VSSLYDAFDDGRDIEMEDLVRNTRQSIPLSRTMREQIDALREWAVTRARPASSQAAVPVVECEALPESPREPNDIPAPDIGGPGSRAGQFASPGGLAVDAAGNLYVADSYNHRVQRITPSGDVYLLGRRGKGPGEFLNPQAVVTDSSLGFCVLEQGGCRIQRFGSNGEWQGAFGFRGSGRGEMFAPTAMARGP